MFESFWTVGRCARELRCSEGWVRSLELRGVLTPVARDSANRRLYAPDDVRRVRREREQRAVAR